jgi:hypothetical protein
MRTDVQDMGSSNGSFVNNIRQVLYSINNNNNTGAPICKQEERKPRTWKTRQASIHEQSFNDFIALEAAHRSTARGSTVAKYYDKLGEDSAVYK